MHALLHIIEEFRLQHECTMKYILKVVLRHLRHLWCGIEIMTHGKSWHYNGMHTMCIQCIVYMYSLCAVLKIHKDYLATNFNGISDYLNGISNGAFKQFVALRFFLLLFINVWRQKYHLNCKSACQSSEMKFWVNNVSQRFFFLNKSNANSIHAICFKANQGAFFYTQTKPIDTDSTNSTICIANECVCLENHAFHREN